MILGDDVKPAMALRAVFVGEQKSFAALLGVLESAGHCVVVNAGVEFSSSATKDDCIVVARVPDYSSATDLGRAWKEESAQSDGETGRRRVPILLVCDGPPKEGVGKKFHESFDDCLFRPHCPDEWQLRLASLERLVLQEDAAALFQGEIRRRNQLTAFIVHDMRNPLSAILGNVQLMEECYEGSDPIVSQCVEDLSHLGDRILSMVNSLLDVEELEEGRLVPSLSEVLFDKFLGVFPKLYKTSLEARRATIELQVEKDLSVRIDKGLLFRVVENLLDNAIRYTPRGGTVLLSGQSSGQELQIVVGNSGPEVVEAERERIFQRYYRLDNKREGARVSRGLGLYFCQLAVEAHGGTIEVRSRPNFPACFEITLPSSVLA